MSDSTDSVSRLSDIVKAISGLTVAISKLFIGSSSVSSTATAGTLGAPPAQVAGYITVTLPGGGTGKVAFYNS